MQKKWHEDKVDSGRILRFDHKDTILSRGFWDPDIVPLMQEFGSKWIGIVLPTRANDSGLGEQGRAGWIITKEFGPRVRLCKVFTDLPLEPDKPRNFGVAKFCSVCSRCAKSCPVQAISYGDPTDKGPTNGNFHGIHKWYMNPIKCFSYWAKLGTDCGICVRVCPWNKPNTLPHKIIRNVLANSPFRKLAIWGDRIAGYGMKRTDDLFE